MYCPQCAAQLVDSDKFCRACGADIKAAALALAKQPLSSKGGKNKIREPKKEKTWQEKRSKGVRETVEGATMIVATLLVGVAFFLLGSHPARMLIWGGIFGWIACWGIIALATGLGAIMETASMTAKATEPQPVDSPAPVPDTDPLDNSSLSPLLSVTENTTRSLEPAIEEYAVKKMKVYAIEHAQLAMPPGGEETARSFYSGVLELAEKPKPPHLAARGGVWFEQGELKIHLGAESDFRPAKKAHPALLVDGLDELIKQCEQAGAQVVWDEPLDGFRRVYVNDPFGNRIELMERIALETRIES